MLRKTIKYIKELKFNLLIQNAKLKLAKRVITDLKSELKSKTKQCEELKDRASNLSDVIYQIYMQTPETDIKAKIDPTFNFLQTDINGNLRICHDGTATFSHPLKIKGLYSERYMIENEVIDLGNNRFCHR